MANFTKPASLPEWASSLANVLEPPEAKKDEGWLFQEIPPSQFENWRANTVYTWFQWLDERLADGADADEFVINDPSGAYTEYLKFSGDGTEGVFGLWDGGVQILYQPAIDRLRLISGPDTILDLNAPGGTDFLMFPGANGADGAFEVTDTGADTFIRGRGGGLLRFNQFGQTTLSQTITAGSSLTLGTGLASLDSGSSPGVVASASGQTFTIVSDGGAFIDAVTVTVNSVQALAVQSSRVVVPAGFAWSSDDGAMLYDGSEWSFQANNAVGVVRFDDSQLNSSLNFSARRFQPFDSSVTGTAGDINRRNTIHACGIFNGSGVVDTAKNRYNLASVSRITTGTYNVSFSTAAIDDVVVVANSDLAAVVRVTSPTTTGVTLQSTGVVSQSLTDSEISFAAIGS